MSDAFSPTGNTLFGLGEGWRLGRACRRQDMMQKVAVVLIQRLLSFSPEIKQLLFYEKSQEVLSPISASFIAEHSGPVTTVQLSCLLRLSSASRM